ncbi:alpha/beta hydrolase [Rhodoferax sp. PAMC 29310]|uniref:alpha/beta hydrolase n=1 Tax=Rhodoferax sp. PAMC 29310 TaxID=2822760 RepID=UPI001B31FCC3|nr:alpha/beta fold hydrolase [Rhodoferax sp. PAMC 29310]
MGNNKVNWGSQSVRSVTAALLMPVKALSRLLRVMLLMSLLATSGCAWLDTRQRQIIYRPTTGMPADFPGLRAGDERYFLPAPQANLSTTPSTTEANQAQRIEVWWLPHADPLAPTLLYLHGTFRNLFDNIHKINALRAAGFAVLAVDYRGWGLSTPITPSERSIVQDADLAWGELKRRAPTFSQRVIYGHSMGSGVAVDLASRLEGRADYGGLVLESAFTSFTEVASEAGFLARVLVSLNDERFASINKIARVNAPLLMLHGNLDSTIPLLLGKRLFDAAQAPKQWVVIEGGHHSDLQEVDEAAYQAALARFKAQWLTGP